MKAARFGGAICLLFLCLALDGCAGKADVDGTSAPGAYSGRDDSGSDSDSASGDPPKGLHLMPGGAGFTHAF